MERERRQVAEREKEAKEQAKKKSLKKKQLEAEREKEELAGITGKWEDRYKNLALYLNFIKILVNIFTALLTIGVLSVGAHLCTNAPLTLWNYCMPSRQWYSLSGSPCSM